MRKLEKHLCLALCAWLYYDCILLYLLCPGKNPCRVWLPCQNTNPASRRGNWTRTQTTQSDLRFQSATHKDVLRKSQRGKYQERNSSTGITHEWHYVCTKWLNQMTQGRASSSTNSHRSDLLGSKSKTIKWRTRMGHCTVARSTDFPNVWTGLQTENYCCRNYTVVETWGKISKTFCFELPCLKSIIKVWHQYLGGCLKYF